MPLLYLVFLSLFLVIFVQLGIFGIVLEKVGLSPDSAMLLLGSTLFGSMINLPLFTITSTAKKLTDNVRPPPRLLFSRVQSLTVKIVVAINVGGALIPFFFSLYLIFFHQLNP